jgi:hypothetical protein
VTKPADIVPIHPAIPVLPGSPPRTLPALALWELERAAVTQLATGDVESVRQYVVNRASAYASGDADVRRRALSRAAAVQEAQMQELSALLARAVVQRDIQGVQLLDRTLTSATNRYRGLLEQLRVEFVATRRVAVVAKGTIAIAAEEQL